MLSQTGVRINRTLSVDTYMHACIHTYIHTYIYTYIDECMHTYIHTYTHTQIYAHTGLLFSFES